MSQRPERLKGDNKRGLCVCLLRRLTWLQAGAQLLPAPTSWRPRPLQTGPRPNQRPTIYLLRIWEKLGGRSSLTAWQQRSDIGCQASRITCAGPAEHLTPATGARLQCPRVQDNCNNRLLQCRGAMRSCCRVRRTHGHTAVERSLPSAPLSRPHLSAHRRLLSLPLSTHKPIVVDLPAGLRPSSA